MSKHDQISMPVSQDSVIKKDEKVPSFMVPLFKLPVFLHRLNLGWLLGMRFMQLTM